MADISFHINNTYIKKQDEKKKKQSLNWYTLKWLRLEPWGRSAQAVQIHTFWIFTSHMKIIRLSSYSAPQLICCSKDMPLTSIESLCPVLLAASLILKWSDTKGTGLSKYGSVSHSQWTSRHQEVKHTKPLQPEELPVHPLLLTSCLEY